MQVLMQCFNCLQEKKDFKPECEAEDGDEDVVVESVEGEAVPHKQRAPRRKRGKKGKSGNKAEVGAGGKEGKDVLNSSVQIQVVIALF